MQTESLYDGDPWDVDARLAVKNALEEATFNRDGDGSVVTLPSRDDGTKHPSDVECRSVKDLVDELRERAETAWCGSVPADGGDPLFDFDGDGLVYDVLDGYRSKLAKLGWKL